MEQQINRSIEIFMPVIKTFLVNDSRLWNICEIIIAIFHLINWTLHLCKLLKDKYSGKFYHNNTAIERSVSYVTVIEDYF